MPRRAVVLTTLLILAATLSVAKKQDMVMMWPKENPTVKLTFGTFHEWGSYAGKMTLVSDVVVQNLTNKVMPRASFNVSLLDRNNVRIGNGLLIVDDLNPGQSAKVQFQCNSVGQPALLNIAARNSGGVPTSTKMIPVTIISIPPGANLKVDDQAVGTTPLTVRVLGGTHNLELHKDGYADAKTPLDVNPDELPGGSITITLGGMANDTIELRDGSILIGDVISMSLESVVINVRGSEQTFDRNKIKKIFLVERTVTHITVPETPAKANPPATDSQTPHP
ncbi:MAG: PEGA domain-containing protein [Terriglobales bacterium]